MILNKLHRATLAAKLSMNIFLMIIPTKKNLCSYFCTYNFSASIFSIKNLVFVLINSYKNTNNGRVLEKLYLTFKNKILFFLELSTTHI